MDKKLTDKLVAQLQEIKDKLKDFNERFKEPKIARYATNEAKIKYLESLIKSEENLVKTAFEKEGIKIDKSAKINYLKAQIEELRKINTKIEKELNVIGSPLKGKVWNVLNPDYNKLLKDEIDAKIKIEDLKIVIIGAGAAGLAACEMYKLLEQKQLL